MSILMFLFWILMIWFFVLLIKTIFKGVRVYRAFTQPYREMKRAARQHANQSHKDEQPQPHKPRKKIDSDVGEYVHFEEVDVSVDTTTTTDSSGNRHTTTNIKVEEQVIDAEWEDIKD